MTVFPQEIRIVSPEVSTFMDEVELSEKENFLSRAESCLDQGLYTTAQDLAMDWLNRFPGDAEARIIACHACTRMGKLDKVNSMLKEVDEAILGMSRIYARMGDICRQSGLNQEAIIFYRKFVTINPNAPLTLEVEEKLASLLNFPEDTGLSLPENGMLPKHPAPSLQTVTMAELYLKQGHPDMAIEVLEAILRKDESNQRAQTLLSNIRKKMDEPPEQPGRSSIEVIRELTRWLNNMHRIRSHAA